ncbi:MAG: DUF5317 domain-containing protein [Bacillota bacterium]
MFSGALVLAILLGLATGGSLMRLAELRLRRPELAFLAVGLQIGISIGLARGIPWVVPWRFHLYVLAYCLLFVAVALNIRLPGIPVLGLGAALNCLVIVANGGRMPVSPAVLERVGLGRLIPGLAAGVVATHQLLGPETRLKWLADIFPLGPPYPRPAAFSIGDALIAAGLLWLVHWAMRPLPTGRERAKIKH